MTYETAEDLGESGLLYVLLSCITPCVPVMMLRMHAREKYNIEVSRIIDIFANALQWRSGFET